MLTVIPGRLHLRTGLFWGRRSRAKWSKVRAARSWGKCQVGATEIYLFCCDGGTYCEEAEPVEGWMNETEWSAQPGAAVVKLINTSHIIKINE